MMNKIRRKAVSFETASNTVRPTTTSQKNTSVPVVVIGITRSQAVKSQLIFSEFNAASPESRPYTLAAVLDFLNSPREYQFSAHNLGVVLHTLHPRPQVLITGTAIPDAFLNIIKSIWNDYVKEIIEKEARMNAKPGAEDNPDRTDGRSCWVQMSKTHPGTGPPAPGAFEEALRQLDEVFRS